MHQEQAVPRDASGEIGVSNDAYLGTPRSILMSRLLQIPVQKQPWSHVRAPPARGREAATNVERPEPWKRQHDIRFNFQRRTGD
jgi:hypothetical protein